MKLSEDRAIRYHTKIADQVGGPYTIEGLESLVYLKKITPDTLIAREGTDDFCVIRASALSPVLFPGLAIKQASKTPQDWSPPGQENDPAQINRKRFRTTTAKFENVNAKAGHVPKVDVYEILDDIRVAEKNAGLDIPREGRFKISKRSLDFWFMIIVGNVLILGGAIAMQSTMSMVFGIGGSALYSMGLLWSMYGVMDRY